MAQAALQREDDGQAGAEIEQSQGFALAGEAHQQQQTTCLSASELEAAFALFGTLQDHQQGKYAYGPYQTEIAPGAPANDMGVERRLPELTRRGLHLDPKRPLQIIKALDWFIVIAAAELAARWGAGVGLLQISIRDGTAFLLSAIGLKAGLWLTDAYRTSPATMRADNSLGGLTLGAIVGLIAANLLSPNARDAGALSATLPIAAILLAGAHAALALWIGAAHRRGVFAEVVVVIGATDAAKRFVRRANKTGEARIVAIADDRLARAPHAVGETPVGGDLDALLAWEGLPHVDRIVIAVTQKTRVRDIIARLKPLPHRVDLLLDYCVQGVRGHGMDRMGGAPIANLSGRPRNIGNTFVKRMQDCVIGAVLLAMLALPMLAIAISIRLESKGPALYRQRRHGFNNRVFTVFKFRTMRHEPAALSQSAPDGDPPITRVGGFLRRTGLDALPMLFNVLSGDMSLVGPRPHALGVTAATRALDDIIPDYAHRHRVKPGITGWAQINGASGTLLTSACVHKRVRLDLEYVARASLWFDLQILARSLSARDRRADPT